MVKVTIEDALNNLHLPLRQRIDAVIAHLYDAPWADHQALCFAGSTAETPAPRHWTAPNRTEVDQMRYDGYRWSQRQLLHHGEGPITLADALARIQDGAAEIVRTSVEMIGACVTGLVEKDARTAVVSRERLVHNWTWPLGVKNGGALLHLMLSLCPTLPRDEPLLAAWPPEAASAEVAEWARRWLDKNAINENVVDRMKQTRRLTPMVFDVRAGLPYRCMVTPALALLYLLEREVKENQQRTFIAIDTCKEHTKLVESWRDLPKSKRTTIHSPITHGRLELILPDSHEKRHLQLSLALPDEPLASQVSSALREWRSWVGLRHWVAFQSQITVNQRLGWVRWTVEEHLKAMGYRKDRRRRLELRRAAAEMIELFTQIELGIYDDKGKIRERRPLVLKGNTYERLVGSEWEIEGLELKINPLLYRGVRDPETGKLGSNWWPTPKELPHIDHQNYGPAIALGTVLPARWRMEIVQSNKSYIDLKGDSLLRAAGLPYRQRNVVATWRSVERNLTELQRRGGLEEWQWQGSPDLSTVCRLYAPTWAVDRIAHGVPPKENKPSPAALTGSELKSWRKKEGLTQRGAAQMLGVGESTIRRAERNPTRPLSKNLREALSSLTT